MAGGRKGWVVGVTGATSDLGRLLIPRLLADPRVAKVVVLDIAAPAETDRCEFRRVDLTRPDAEQRLTDQLREAKVDALYHLAFLSSRIRGAAFAHELEVIGSMHVLAAAGTLKLPRLILPSMTALYGARPTSPSVLTEDAPLSGCAGSRFINDKVEVENQLKRFAKTHPDTKVLVLRFAPVVGPTANNPVTRWLGTKVIPTLLGFDPLWQVLHEEDAADALHVALTTEAEGVFNVVAEGVLPLSSLVKLSGGRVLPLPSRLVTAALTTLASYGAPTTQPSMLDFMHFSWVADGRRAQEQLPFVPRYDAVQAVSAIHEKRT